MVKTVCSSCNGTFDGSPERLKKTGPRCQECIKARDRAWRKKRKEDGSPVTSTKMPREYHRSYEEQYFSDDKNRLRRNENMKRYRESSSTRHHHEARWKANRAIHAGVLIRKPCEICGEIKVDAHHDDYEKPLDIRWLCRTHHMEYHAKSRGEP